MSDAGACINTSSWFQTNDGTINQQLDYILENKNCFEKLHKELVRYTVFT
jgi:hypothetical protein